MIDGTAAGELCQAWMARSSGEHAIGPSVAFADRRAVDNAMTTIFSAVRDIDPASVERQTGRRDQRFQSSLPATPADFAIACRQRVAEILRSRLPSERP